MKPDIYLLRKEQRRYAFLNTSIIVLWVWLNSITSIPVEELFKIIKVPKLSLKEQAACYWTSRTHGIHEMKILRIIIFLFNNTK